MVVGVSAPLFSSSSASSPRPVRPRALRPGSAWLGAACWVPVLLALACGGEEDAPLADAASTGGGNNVAQGITTQAGSGGGTAQEGSASSGASGSAGASSEGIGGTSSTGGSSSTVGSDQGAGGSAGSGTSLPAAGDGETGVFVGMTAAHNLARQEEMQDPPLPDLTWSQEIADFAQEYADQLTTQCGTLVHRTQNRYGENLATFGTTAASNFYTPEEAVDGWVSEKACWDYGTIRGTETCDQTCADGLNSTGCGHYTQVIWRDTKRVGCGYSTCQNGNFNMEIWVCNYDPPGNYIGEAPY
jgi:uncharacterized protein YkwD